MDNMMEGNTPGPSEMNPCKKKRQLTLDDFVVRSYSKEPEESEGNNHPEPECDGSQDLFPFSDDEDDAQENTLYSSPQTKEPQEPRPVEPPEQRGPSLEDLRTGHIASEPICPGNTHTVLFKVAGRCEPLCPYPKIYQDKWDKDHVRLPCSPESFYPCEMSGKKILKPRWEVIKLALSQKIETSKELEAAILSYNSQYRHKWKFDGLHNFINREITEEERRVIFEDIIPSMVDLTLNLPNICTQGIPFLKRGERHSLSMSQHQITCILANAFFCTFPRRNNLRDSALSSINFNRLFGGGNPKLVEKLRCLFHYFRKVSKETRRGTITFTRHLLGEAPDLACCGAAFTPLAVCTEGLIEREGRGMLQVDFANKKVGGGVLGFGLVQEEIRFLVAPELIAARLFTEELGPRDSLLITGCEQYSEYEGYSDTFKWIGDHRDTTHTDEFERRLTHVVAMDAICYADKAQQFHPACIRQETFKALSAFSCGPPTLTVATGNWGCGAFKGDKRLKSLIQIMAASYAKRSMAYFTFGDKLLMEDIYQLHSLFVDLKLTIGDAWRMMLRYCDSYSGEPSGKDLFEFISGTALMGIGKE